MDLLRISILADCGASRRSCPRERNEALRGFPPMSDDAGTFVLVGHDCPLGEYPSVVVPVGTVGQQLVVLYNSPTGPELVPVSNESEYAKHSVETTRMLSDFDGSKHGLFALGEQSVLMYLHGQEAAFFANLLRSGDLVFIDPLYRFSLAKDARQHDLILHAFA